MRTSRVIQKNCLNLSSITFNIKQFTNESLNSLIFFLQTGICPGVLKFRVLNKASSLRTSIEKPYGWFVSSFDKRKHHAFKFWFKFVTRDIFSIVRSAGLMFFFVCTIWKEFYSQEHQGHTDRSIDLLFDTRSSFAHNIMRIRDTKHLVGKKFENFFSEISVHMDVLKI